MTPPLFGDPYQQRSIRRTFFPKENDPAVPLRQELHAPVRYGIAPLLQSIIMGIFNKTLRFIYPKYLKMRILASHLAASLKRFFTRKRSK